MFLGPCQQKKRLENIPTLFLTLTAVREDNALVWYADVDFSFNLMASRSPARQRNNKVVS